MKNFLWFLVVLFILALALPGCTTPAAAPPDGSLRLTVSAARVANCKLNGGCGLYSHNELLQMMQEAAEAGARQTCPAKNKVLL